MTANPRRAAEWSNIGFALVGVGLLRQLAAPAPTNMLGQWLFLLLCGTIFLGFLYPLRSRRLDRARTLVGIMSALCLVVFVWLDIGRHR